MAITKITELRKAYGITQKQLAEDFEISLRTVQSWDSGARKPPLWAEKLLVEAMEEKYGEENARMMYFWIYGANDQEVEYFTEKKEAITEAESYWGRLEKSDLKAFTGEYGEFGVFSGPCEKDEDTGKWQHEGNYDEVFNFKSFYLEKVKEGLSQEEINSLISGEIERLI